MPYNKDGIKYSRITEVSGFTECEMLAWIEKNKPADRPQRFGVVTLAGTLVHQRIAKKELSLMPKPYKENVLELTPADKLTFSKLLKNHQRTKDKELDQPSKYQIIMNTVKTLYMTYEQFLMSNPHEPLYVEEKRWCKDYKIAGTVDLIFIKKMRGVIKELILHRPPNKYPIKATYFFENPAGEEHNVVTILDWKSSKSKSVSHKIQMSGYHFMWEYEGDFDRLRKQGFVINGESWSVLLGERKRISKKEIQEAGGNPLPYQVFKYNCDSKDFLEGLEVRDGDPLPIAKDLKGNEGMKGRCLICADILHCPEWSYRPRTTEETYNRDDIFIPLQSFTQKQLALITLIASRLKDEPELNFKLQQLVHGVKAVNDILKDENLLEKIYSDTGLFSEKDIKETLDVKSVEL